MAVNQPGTIEGKCVILLHIPAMSLFCEALKGLCYYKERRFYL